MSLLPDYSPLFGQLGAHHHDDGGGGVLHARGDRVERGAHLGSRILTDSALAELL